MVVGNGRDKGNDKALPSPARLKGNDNYHGKVNGRNKALPSPARPPFADAPF